MASWTWVIKRGGMMMTIADEEAAYKAGLQSGTTVVAVPLPEVQAPEPEVSLFPGSLQHIDKPTLSWE